MTTRSPGLEIVNRSLPRVKEGQEAVVTLIAINGTDPYTFTVIAGNNYVDLNGSALTILSSAPPGKYTITIMVQDSASPAKSVVKDLPLEIEAKPKIEITTPAVLGKMVAGKPVKVKISTIHHTGAVSLIVSDEPAGLVIATTTTGEVEFTPDDTHVGSISFKVQAIDDKTGDVTDKIFTGTVDAAPKLEIIPVKLPKMVAGKPVKVQTRTRNHTGPVTLDVINDPDDLMAVISPTGEMTFTPEEKHEGSVSVEIQATDDNTGRTATLLLNGEVTAGPKFAIKANTVPRLPRELEAGSMYSVQLQAENASGNVQYWIDPSVSAITTVHPNGRLLIMPTLADVGKTYDILVHGEDGAGHTADMTFTEPVIAPTSPIVATAANANKATDTQRIICVVSIIAAIVLAIVLFVSNLTAGALVLVIILFVAALIVAAITFPSLKGPTTP